MLVMEMGRKVCVEHITFAPDGRSLAAGGDPGVFLWREIGDGVRAKKLPGPLWADSVRFAADGRWLFTGRYELWRIEPGAASANVLQLWGGYNLQFDVSPGGMHVLASQCLSSPSGGRTRLALWRADTLTPAGKVWEQDFAGFTRYAPQFLAGADRFVRIEYAPSATSHFSAIRVVTHDTATGAAIDATTIAEGYPYEVLVAPDGKMLALRGTTHVTVFTLPPTDAPVTLRSDGRRHFTGIAFHPTGRFLAATNNDRTVKLLDTATGTEARTFTWQLDRMRSVCFSPDGTLAAAGTGKGQVVVWDVDL